MSDSSPLRIALLASCTIDLVKEPLAASLSERGIAADFWIAGFAQYRQVLIDPESECYRFDPHIAILYLDGEDLFAPLLEHPLGFNKAGREEFSQRRVAEVSDLVAQLKHRLPRASVFLNTVALPPLNVLGSLEYNSGFSIQDAASVYNSALAGIARHTPGVVVIDVAAVMDWLGYSNWHDTRLWHLARSRWSRHATRLLGRRYAAAVAALSGKMRKCIVLDLDNTLWGGTVGEDGVEGLRLGDEGVGLAFREFQTQLLNLQRQGVLLAICSKNNPDDALQAIRNHPAMCLREEHFAAMRINWDDKPSNLRALARELNIGLDSMVFVDDNPVERSWLREALPDVYVPEWPSDPSDYKDALLELAAEHFVKFAITAEDLTRGEQYRQQTLRSQAAATASLEDFYSSLEMRVTIAPAAASTIPRIAQLTQKTNQFNLTTRRYTEADIATLAAAADSSVYSLELDDSFGRNGIVGVMILRRHSDDAWIIDTFLLSCRVIGRTVENAFLGYIADTVRKCGARRLLGEYRATAKNAPVSQLYRGIGFRMLQDDSTSQLWELDLGQQTVAIPEWFTLSALEDKIHAGQTFDR
jgi:FkbH-like protein